MPYCKQCGAEIGDVKFCPGCGASVGKFRAANSETVASSDAAPEVPGFLRALAICLGKKYCCFKGRASRSEFWFFFLGIVLPIVGFSLVVDVAFLHFPISLALKLFLFLPLLSVGIRRYHDVGLPGWIFVALFLIVMALNVAFRAALAYSFLVKLVLEGVTASSINELQTRLPIWSYYVYGAIILTSLFNLIFLSERGTRGPNKYGPAPARLSK